MIPHFHLTIGSLLVINSIHASPFLPNNRRFQHPVDDNFEKLINEVAVYETPESKQGDVNYRLPDDVIPYHYDLEITPYFTSELNRDEYTFDGTETIYVTAKNPVNSIVLHINNISISEWSVMTLTGTPIPHGDASYDSITHKLTLPLQQALQASSNYTLHFKYLGFIQEEMVGFYRSYYKDGNIIRRLGSTQFEQTDARRAFPCFDEPHLKATFQLIINRLPGYSPTLSNTPIISTGPDNINSRNRVKETFAKTPKMSTYLVAFVVSQFANRTTGPNNNFGVFSRPQAIGQIDYSLEFGPKITNELGAWLDYDYYSVPEMTKLDIAAIPDFFAGAMENWGLMTHKETASLFAAGVSSAMNKQRIAAVITHEVAHQWFGNLITCEWWSVAWLHEAFARYFQYYANAWLETSWDLDIQFVVDQIHVAFQIDSTESTHPLTDPSVQSPDQAGAIFDNISYNKGASITRMVEHFMGASAFQTALRNYIRNNAFTAVAPESLFKELELQKEGTTRFMEPWTLDPGYPYVKVSISSNTVVITQERFLVNNKNHNDLTRYNVPITFATRASEFANTSPIDVLYKDQPATKTLTIPVASQNGNYFIMNNQQVGYYRVNYDNDNWERIREALEKDDHDGIHVLNRAQIVDDLFNFARADIVKYDTALDIIDYIRNEKNYAPWLPAFNALSLLENKIKSADRRKWSNYIRYLLENIYDHLGFNAKSSDSVIDKYNRNNVLNWACKHGHQNCIDNAKAEFGRYLANPTTYAIDPDLRSAVYCNAIRYGDGSEFGTLWSKYLSENVAAEQITILTAMGCTKDQEQLEVYFNAILSDDIRPQDKSAAFGYLYQGNPDNVDIAFDLLITNFQKYDQYLSVTSAFNNLASRFTTQAQVDKLRTFAQSNQVYFGTIGYNSLLSYAQSAENSLQKDATFIPDLIDYVDDKSGVAITVGSFGLITILLSIVHFRLMF